MTVTNERGGLQRFDASGRANTAEFVTDSTGAYVFDLKSLAVAYTYDGSGNVLTATYGPDKAGMAIRKTKTWSGTQLLSESSWALLIVAAVPGIPGVPVATLSGSGANVSFAAAAANNSPITGYTVFPSPPGPVDANAGSTALTHAMTGLVDGVAYTFIVSPSNAIGPGTSSASSNSVTRNAVVIPAAPDQPARPVLTALVSAISVAWSLPAPGSSPILQTQYTALDGTTTDLITNPQTISAAAGVPTTGTVRSRNAQGWGQYSPQAASVTPSAAPTPTVALNLSLNAYGLNAAPF